MTTDKPYFMSIGSDCSVDYNIRQYFPLKTITGPFSWASFSLEKLISALKEKLNTDKYINSLDIKKFSHKHPSISNNTENETHGTLILKNDYGFNFAHEIMEKYQLDEFKAILAKRINRFYSYKEQKITFVRFENKIVKNKAIYISKLESLALHLVESGFSDFNLIIISPFELESEFTMNIASRLINVKCYFYDNSNFVDWKREDIYKAIWDN